MADSNAGSNPIRDEETADRSNGGGVPTQIPRAAERYSRGVTLGQGTYGVVYKAIDTLTNRTVAVKKIRLGAVKEGVNVTALREIKLLKELKDPNIIELIDAYPHKKNLYLVFEFMESDLETVIKDRNIVLSPADIKSYMQMTLKGLAYCHKKWVLHRDMKPNNLLIASDGQLKLGDFGLARIFGSPDRIFTYQVFARWYRAPELLYSAKYYGPAVDIWAAGCIFAELLLRRPLLQGTSDLDQLGKIFSVFGTPRASQWPDMTTLPDYIEYNFVPAQPLRSLFPMASEDALDLLSKMFTYDPKARISAQQALEHRYFSSVPAPTRPELLPKPPSRPEAANPSKAQEPVSSEDRDVVSPSTKARRVMLFPGDPAAGDVHSSRKPGKQATEAGSGSRGGMETAGGSSMSGVEVHPDMSLDKLIANGVAIPPRPRLTDSAKSYLKRKYNLQAAFEQIAQEQETQPDLDSDRHSHKKERHS